MVLLFLYNLLLIIAYTAVIAFTNSQFIVKKERFYLPLVGLFLFYLLDTVIIYLTNAFPSFADWYNHTFMSVPTIKTIVYLVTALCLLQLWNKIIDQPFPPYQGIVLILLGLWYLFIPMMENSALKVWLYYVAFQLFTLSFSLLALKRLNRIKLSIQAQKTLKLLLILTSVFSVLIVLEDSIVIFNFDIYSGNRIYIQDRNYSEDLLRFCYSVLMIRALCLGTFKKSDDFELVLPEPVTFYPPAPDKLVSSPHDASTDENLKSLKYAQSLKLTEREREILDLLLDDQNNQQISDSLCISIGTVKTHVHNIFQKSDVTHRNELIRQYMRFSSDDNA